MLQDLSQASQLNTFSRGLFLLGILFLFLAAGFFVSAGYAGKIAGKIRAFLEAKLENRKKAIQKTGADVFERTTADLISDTENMGTTVLHADARPKTNPGSRINEPPEEEETEEEETEEVTPTDTLAKPPQEKRFVVTKKVIIKHFGEEEQ